MTLFQKIIFKLQSSRIVPDRIYSTIKNYTLSSKINFIIMLAAVPMIAILSLLFLFLYIQLNSQIDSNLEQKMIAGRNAYNYYERQTLVYAKMLADNPYIKKELLAETVNVGPINRVCSQVQKSVFLDRITIHDKNGIVITRIHQNSDFGEDESHLDFVDRAIKKGENTSRIIQERKILILQNTVPVFQDHEVIGSITTGYNLDWNFARQLAALTQSGIFFTLNDKLISSSLGETEKIENGKASGEFPEYKEKNRTWSVKRKIRVHSSQKAKITEYYDFRFLPIVTPGINNSVVNAGIVVAIKPPFSRLLLGILFWGTIILFIVVILFGITFALKIGHDIASFTKLIHDAMMRFKGGEHDTRILKKSGDELGLVALGFNELATELQKTLKEIREVNDNLETLVDQRTLALNKALTEVTKIREKQDGDYFLTSLLAKPLFYNANKSATVKSDFYIHQKKTFEFRNKTGDLGGDICITGNLKLGKPDDFRRYTMIMNGDAMGKSMQGAGGSLVMGVVMNSIMARSAGNKRIMDRTAKEWLTEVYEEINTIFKSFSGTMVISATIMLIDDDTGKIWYFNAEHPFSILYRDGKASFIEEELKLRKLGLDSEIPFEVFTFQLLPGDQVIVGSDGRDDIDLTPDEDVRTFNEDEKQILNYVEEANGDIYEIEELVKKAGDITDDISMMSIRYKAVNTGGSSVEVSKTQLETPSTGAFDEGKAFYQSGDIERAIAVLLKAFQSDKTNQKINKFLGLVSYKGKAYEIASPVLTEYLKENASSSEYWYYLAMSEKKLANYENALNAAHEAFKLDSENFPNLINLADISRLMGNLDRALTYVTRAHSIDPENKDVLKLTKLLDRATNTVRRKKIQT